MKGKLNSRKSGLLVFGLCLAVFLAASVVTVAGQGSYSSGSNATGPSASVSSPQSSAPSGSNAPVSSTSGSDRTYCVSMGYLYRTNPGVNGNQPICQLSDYSWCDANAFATGKCGASIGATGFNNSYGNYYPYFYDYPYSNNYPYTGTTPGAAIDACTGSGGNVTNVHTPYGDVDVCKFPNGNIMDLNGLYNGFSGDKWYYYAYNFLNAP
jgi:putative hemolysin